MWTEYTKIDTVAQRDLNGTKRLMDGTFRDTAIKYLQNVKMEVTEKLDGTNTSIFWDGHRLAIHGRTNAAQLPKELMEMLETKFGNEQMEQMFEQLFPPKTDEAGNQILPEVTIYGEGIGPKIQKVGKLYGDQYRFLVFDIKIGNTYLEHSNPFYKEIVKAFTVEEVPSLPDMTPNEAIAFVKTNPRSLINPDAPMEGVVLRPKVRLYGPNGARLIVKVKCRDYEPYNEIAEKYKWLKQGKCVVYEEKIPDGDTIGCKRHRCTVQKIFSESGKIEAENTVVALREIDTGMVVANAILENIHPYKKEEWNK